MLQYNKQSQYSGSHWHKYDAIGTFLSLIPDHDGNTAIELIVVTNKLITGIYTIGSNSGLNITKVLQDHFHKSDIPINIWSDNAHKEFMGSVSKLLCAYELESNQSEAHKKNQNPDERRIQ